MSIMIKHCRLCGLPFEALKSNQLYCDYCRDYLHNSTKKPRTETSIEEINRKAKDLGLSYGQMVQRYNL